MDVARAREVELKRQLEMVDKELRKTRAELERLQKELDSVQEEHRYISESEEAKAALREAEARMKTVAERLRRVEELRARLLEELKKAREKSEREIKRARKELPGAVRMFYRTRRQLVETLVATTKDATKQLQALLEATEAYYKTGEHLAETAYRAGEHKGGGWVFKEADLTPPARRLWRVVIAEERLPEELQVDEETLDLLRWWLELLERFPRLRSDFPPCVMTPRIERELAERARKSLEELERRRREHRERLQRQGHLEAPLGERA